MKGFDGVLEGEDEAGATVWDVACADGESVMGFEGAVEGDDEAGMIV